MSVEGFAKPVALALGAGGLLFVVGTVVDLGALWLAQRQATLQWEFIAITRTTDALPRFVLGIALLYAALYLGRRTSVAMYRTLGAVLIAVGLVGAWLSVVMLTDYFALARTVAPESLATFRSTVVKAIALGTLYLMVLVPAGYMGLKGPKKPN